MRPTDLRFALRRWRRRPALAIVATLVLALGIGATTAMYSIVNAVLLKDEPWQNADRLVRIYAVQPHQRTNPAYANRWDRMPIAWQSWRDLQNSRAFADVAVFVPDQQIIGDEQTELARAFFASSTLPLLVGAKPAIGRFFTRLNDAAVPWLVADECVKHHVHHRAVLGPGCVVWIERREIGSIDTKAQHWPCSILRGNPGESLQPDCWGYYRRRKHRANYTSSGSHVNPPSD